MPGKSPLARSTGPAISSAPRAPARQPDDQDLRGNAAIQEALEATVAGGGNATALLDTYTDLSGLGKNPTLQSAGTGFAVGSGLMSAATHKPASTTAVGKGAERVAVGATDTLWNLTAGPLAAVDSLTGGHVGGTFKGGASAATALVESAMTGDMKGLEDVTASLEKGDHGKIAQALANVGGDAGDGIGKVTLPTFKDDAVRTPEDERYLADLRKKYPNAEVGLSDMRVANQVAALQAYVNRRVAEMQAEAAAQK